VHSETPLVLTALVFGYALVSGLIKRWYLAPALIFVLLGMALGPFGLNLLDAGPGTEGYTVLAQVALTVILFVQASRLDVGRVMRRGLLSFRLIVIGIPLTLVLGALTAAVLLPILPWWEAVCLAAVVAPTEVALIESLLDDERVPDRVRNALSVESGFSDGIALAILLAAVALASARVDPDPGNWVWFAFRTEVLSLFMGVIVGLAGGLLVVWSRRRGWLNDIWAQLATLAIALICFEVGEGVHASGFVAAFTGGLAFAFVTIRGGTAVPGGGGTAVPEGGGTAVPEGGGTAVPNQVSDATAQLLELMVFAMFGAFAVIDGWRNVSWRVVAFSIAAVFAVRMVAVLVALVRTDLPLYSRAFIGWFGLRGIGTLVLGLLVINRGEIQHTDIIAQTVVVTVTLSLVLHSVTTPMAIRGYRTGDR
jgi:NhaP-type Na+/H+ or K+/H+ antiporter